MLAQHIIPAKWSLTDITCVKEKGLWSLTDMTRKRSLIHMTKRNMLAQHIIPARNDKEKVSNSYDIVKYACSAYNSCWTIVDRYDKEKASLLCAFARDVEHVKVVKTSDHKIYTDAVFCKLPFPSLLWKLPFPSIPYLKQRKNISEKNQCS